MLTCKSPGGISYVWSPDGGEAFDCTAGNEAKQVCKGAVTASDADRLIKRLCSQFPALDICSSYANVGLIVDRQGRGVGMVSPKGVVKKLPSAIPPAIVHDAVSNGEVALVEDVDDKELTKYVKKAPIATVKQQDGLLAAIRKGHELKTVGDEQRCDKGWYYSNKLGRCVSMNLTPDNREILRAALEKKFAGMRGNI